MIDLYGGFVEIFFNGKDNVARNVTNIAFGQTTGGSKQFVNFVQSVRLKISVVNFTEMEITFTPPFEQAVRMINSGVLGLGFQGKSTGVKEAVDINEVSNSPQNFGFNTISVRLHYGGKKSNWYKGILLAPDLSISSEDIAITVKATGMFFPATKTSSNEVFQASTRKSIFERTIENLKDKLEVVFNPDDAKCRDAFNTIEDYNASETDVRTMRELLSKGNCVMIDRGTNGPSGKPKFEIFSKDFLRKQTRNVPIFVLRKQINPNNGRFPILEMQTTVNNYLLGQSLGIQQSAFNPSTKTTEGVESGKINQNTIKERADSRASTDNSMPGSPSGENVKLPAKHAPESLKDTFKGLFTELTDAPLQYTVKTVGIMDLTPGGMARMDVAGVKFLSGDYDLYEVEHNFSQSGVETSVVLARTYGLAGLINSGMTKAQAKITEASSGNKKTSSKI